MERCYICKLDVTSAHIIEHELSDIHNLNLKICNEGNERLKDHANRRGVKNTSHKAGTFYCDICNDVIEVNIIVHKASATHKTNQTQIQNIKSLYEDYTNSNLKKVDKNNTLQQYLDYLNVCHQVKHLRANGNQYVMMTGVNGDKVNVMANLFHSIQTGEDGNVKCNLCNKEISIVDDHVVESEHIKNIKEPVPDKHCIIKCVSRNLDYCLLCNVLMPYTQKFRHIEDAIHKDNVEKALVWENKGQNAALDNYSSHISDGPDGKGIKKYCLVCRVEVPDNIRNIEGHLAGAKHKTNFKDILDKNKLVATRDKYLCGICDCTLLEADIFKHLDSSNHKARLSNPAPKKNAEIYEPGTECTLCKVDVSGLNKVEHKLGFIHQKNIKKARAKSQPETVAMKEIDSKTKVQAKLVTEEKSTTNSVESGIDSDDCTVGVIKKNLRSIVTPEIRLKSLAISKERDNELSNFAGMSLLELESYITFITINYPAKHKIRVINEKFLEVTAANGDEVTLTIEKFHTFTVLAGIKKCLVCHNVFQSTYHHIHSTEHMRNIMIDIMDKHCVRNLLSPHIHTVSFCLHCLILMDKEDSDIHKTIETHKNMLDLALFTPKRIEINNTPKLKMLCYPQKGNFLDERINESELDHQLEKTLNPKEVLCKICNISVPNVESNIRCHLKGARHGDNKKQFLIDNNIATFVYDYECQKCVSFVEARNLFDHVISHSIKQ